MDGGTEGTRPRVAQAADDECPRVPRAAGGGNLGRGKPAGKATAAETPPTKTAAPAIRGMNRPARIVRIFMKATCMARENIISPTSVIFGEEDLQNLREYTQLNTAVNLEDNFARHTLCNLRKKSVLMSHVAIS